MRNSYSAEDLKTCTAVIYELDARVAKLEHLYQEYRHMPPKTRQDHVSTMRTIRVQIDMHVIARDAVIRKRARLQKKEEE